MMNFRPDKKLKRKNGYEDWRKKKNILTNYLKEFRNREMAGLPSKGCPVFFSKIEKRKAKMMTRLHEVARKKMRKETWLDKIKNLIKKYLWK